VIDVKVDAQLNCGTFHHVTLSRTDGDRSSHVGKLTDRDLVVLYRSSDDWPEAGGVHALGLVERNNSSNESHGSRKNDQFGKGRRFLTGADSGARVNVSASPTETDQIISVKLCLSAKNDRLQDFSECLERESTKWRVLKIGHNILTNEREYIALHRVRALPNHVLTALLQPSTSRSPISDGSSGAVEQHTRHLNSDQKAAVAASLTTKEYFTLIQGPPGTGKTSTLLALLLALVKSARNSGENARILVCAPSNAAIDEIAWRLHNGQNLTTDTPKAVRIGGKDQVRAEVWDAMSLDVLSKRELQRMQEADGADTDSAKNASKSADAANSLGGSDGNHANSNSKSGDARIGELQAEVERLTRQIEAALKRPKAPDSAPKQPAKPRENSEENGGKDPKPGATVDESEVKNLETARKRALWALRKVLLCFWCYVMVNVVCD
jgi:hypothetical protein